MATDSAPTPEGDEEPFDTPVRDKPEQIEFDFVVKLDGYEGPLDVLLEMAQRQKVDLRHISVTALVDQYLEFIDAAKRQNLELAADYLVMASWLTYLKSKLLLPQPKEDGEGPTADEMSARLAFQLQRLDAMRKASEELMSRPQMGQEIFARAANDLKVKTSTEWTADLYDLLKAYTTQRVRTIEPVYHRETPKVFQLEAARERLAALLGDIPDWCLLTDLGTGAQVDAPRRSVVASNFGAALEYAKAGKIELRQAGAFAPIYLRRHDELETPQ